MKNINFDMVIIGHMSRDIIVIDGKTEICPGGSAYYAAFPPKYLNIKYLVITKLALKDYYLLGDFWENSIPVLPIADEKSIVMEDRFEKQGKYIRKSTVKSTASPFSLSEIPVEKAKIFYLAGLIYGELPESLILQLSKRGKIALDIQSYLRNLTEKGEIELRDWKLKEKYLSRIFYLKADMEEAQILTGRKKIDSVISNIISLGVKEVIITDNSGVYASDGKNTYFYSFGEYNIEGRQGRGDTCFSSYLSARLNSGIKESLKISADITSKKLKEKGPYSG